MKEYLCVRVNIELYSVPTKKCVTLNKIIVLVCFQFSEKYSKEPFYKWFSRFLGHFAGYTNWRESGERDREKDKDQEGPEPGKDRRWMSRVVNMHVSGGHGNRKNSESREDILPEW